ncbi:MAG: DotI/IcmL family type IV secretion protein [Alphaproteobacteria bacterium]
MKNLWLAASGLALLCTAGAVYAQTAAPAPAPAAAPAPVATAPAPTAAPAPVATAPATAPAGMVGTPAPNGADWMAYSPYAGEESDLKNPNRTQEEIISWAQQRSTDVLSFSPTDIDAKLTKTQKTFTQQGWTDYATYLKDSKLAEMVRRDGYAVTTIVNGDTMILNSGSMAGNYHWLVELPLMVTFLHSGMDGSQQAVAGGEFKLILQLGRVAAKQGIDGMAIESWKMQTKTPAATP